MKKSKYLIVIILFLFSYSNMKAFFIQTNDPILNEIISLNAADMLSTYFQNNKLDSIPLVMKELSKSIHENEWITRVNILYSISVNYDTDSLILHYFHKEYFTNYYKRLEFEEKPWYGFTYQEHKEFYNYLPLRHKLDSLSKSIAMKLIDTRKLSVDEVVICHLFAGNMDEYSELVNDVHNTESKVAMLFSEKFFDYHRQVRLDFHVGYIIPIGNSKIFSNSIAIGGSFGGHLDKDILIYAKALFNLKKNVQPLSYIDDNIIKTTNSANQIIAHIMLGYKTIFNKDYDLIPTAGVGLSYISFTEKFKATTPNEKNKSEYTAINTINLAIGLSGRITIFKGKYLGFELFMNHAFYEYSSILNSNVNNNAITFDIYTNIF